MHRECIRCARTTVRNERVCTACRSTERERTSAVRERRPTWFCVEFAIELLAQAFVGLVSGGSL